LRLQGQLSRPLYVKVAAVIEAMGGRWNKKQQAHLFDGDAAEAVEEVIASGCCLSMKVLFQEFETPPVIADVLVQEAEISPFHSVLEPSACRGNLVAAIRLKSQRLFCCEIQEKHHDHLRSMGADVIGADFLALRDVHFDRIVANPPFTGGQDVKHVMHMWNLLGPGGRLVSVMSPGWTFRETRPFTDFRRFAADHKGEWAALPSSAFRKSGTDVDTGFITLRKEV
jgi:hypothetical protein